MSEIYRLYTEAHYNAATKFTGTGQAQVWDTSLAMGSVAGDMKFTLGGSTQNVNVTHAIVVGAGPSYIRLRYYINTASFGIAATTIAGVIGLRNGTTNYQSLMVYSPDGVDHWIGMATNNDAGTFVSNKWVTGLALGTHWVEYQIKKGSSSVATDAEATLWVDTLDAPKQTQGGFTFYNRFEGINSVAAGTVYSATTGLSGSLYLGKLLITNDANPIGPFLSYRHRPRPAAIMKKRQRIKGHRCG